MRIVTAVVGLVAILAGCATVGRPIDQAKLAQIERGRTTVPQAVALLGLPTSSTTTSGGGQTLVYSYAHAAARPESFIPYIGPFVGGTDVQSSTVLLQFGPDGTLANLISSNSNSGIGMGLAGGGAGVQVAPTPAPTHQPDSDKLGIRAVPTPQGLATMLGLDRPHGMMVVSVASNGIAAGAGMRAGDVLLSLQGDPADTVEEVRAILAAIPPGQSVTAVVRRGRADERLRLQF